jgi:NADH:ubiquinone oxidoreductase subunit E
MKPVKKHITVCINQRANPDMPSCGMRGGLEIVDALKAALAESRLKIDVRTFHCLGRCELGPNAKLSPGGEFCHGLTSTDLAPLLKKIAAFVAG